MADVQGAGGVGADELHLHLLALPQAAVAVHRPQLIDFRDHLPPVGFLYKKIDEPGPGDLHFLEHTRGCGQVVNQAFRDLPGGHLGLLGKDHGQVGGQVTVLRLLGFLHFEGGQGLEANFSLAAG